MGVGWWVLILIGLAFLVAVLRGTLVKVDGRREDVGFDPFFYSFLVECECGLVGFDLDRLGFFGGGVMRHFG